MAQRRRTTFTAEHGTHTGHRQHRTLGEVPCDECRSAYNEYMRALTSRRRREGYVRPGRPKKNLRCDECGASIRSWAARAADGLILCAEHRTAKRQRDRRREQRIRRAKRLAKVAAEGVAANPRWPWVQGVCRQCGDWFTRRGMASPYCSSRCRRRDRPSGSWISRSDRLAIYERDGWICQLCGDPVDRTAHYLDDLAPSLDHIECQSWVLVPDHSPSNLRLAHRLCNSIRGDETWAA